MVLMNFPVDRVIGYFEIMVLLELTSYWNLHFKSRLGHVPFISFSVNTEMKKNYILRLLRLLFLWSMFIVLK